MKGVYQKQGKGKKRNVLRGFIFSVLVVFSGLGLYGFIFERNYIEITHITIADKGLGKVLDGKVALHISDLHTRNMGRRESAILRLTKDISPDFIFLTGDYVGWNGNYEGALTFLSGLQARWGVWAVMGDYDYSNSRKSCLFCHEPGSGEPTRRHPIRFIRNRMEKVTLPGGVFWLGGIDMGGVDKIDSFDRFFQKVEKQPVIILSHNPLTFEFIDRERDVLMLAGDTHGGQVPIPEWLYAIFGYEKNAKYNMGLFKEKNKRMYVSRGVGTSHIPLRLFRRPEVVVIKFTEGEGDRGGKESRK